VVSDKVVHYDRSSGEKSAVLRKLQTIIIFTKEDKTSYGYFTADGNLILEHYDEATDTVTITTYSVGHNNQELKKILFAIANRIFFVFF
jgi:hypothetical protein